MLRGTPCKTEQLLQVDGVWVEFSLAHKGIQVSMYTFHATLGSHGNSWETMVTSQALSTSAAGETFSLTLSPSFQRRMPSQGNKQWQWDGVRALWLWIIAACRSQVTILSTHHWLHLPLDSPMYISSQELSSVVKVSSMYIPCV